MTNKNVMYNLSYDLFALAARSGEKDNGCITNTAIQVTSEPNQIAIAVNKANLTHDMIMETRAFNASILSEAASFDIFKRFGFRSGRDVYKFDGHGGCKRAENGILYVTDGHKRVSFSKGK